MTIRISPFPARTARIRFALWLFLFAVTPVSLFGQLVEIPNQAHLITKAQQLFNEGNVLMNKGDMQQATQKYSEAIEAAPSLPVLYVNRGVAFLSLSKSAEALADAEKALSLLATGTHPPSYAALAYQVKGMVHQNQGDYKLAVEFFSKSIELEPSNAKFWNSRGTAYLMAKENDKALKDYDKGIELDSALPMLYINRATTHMRLKDQPAALRDLDEALKLNDADSSALYTRGNLYTTLSKYDEALKDYDRAISLKAKAPYYHARGRVYFLLGKYELAIKDNTEALTMDPANVHALYNRAICFHKLGRNPLAIDDIRKAVAIKEKSGVMRYMLAYLLFKAGQFSPAVIEATKAIELAPQWRTAYALRSNAYAKLGNAVRAKADRDAAAKLGPGNKPTEDATFFEFTVFVPDDIDQ